MVVRRQSPRLAKSKPSTVDGQVAADRTERQTEAASAREMGAVATVQPVETESQDVADVLPIDSDAKSNGGGDAAGENEPLQPNQDAQVNVGDESANEDQRSRSEEASDVHMEEAEPAADAAGEATPEPVSSSRLQPATSASGDGSMAVEGETREDIAEMTIEPSTEAHTEVTPTLPVVEAAPLEEQAADQDIAEKTTDPSTDPHTEISLSEPMRELAQLAVDMETAASGIPRRRVSPILAAVAPAVAGRALRSKSKQYWEDLNRDRRLAEKLQRKEERELDLRSASSVESPASSGSEFEDSPHVQQAESSDVSSDELASDEVAPAPKKAKIASGKSLAKQRAPTKKKGRGKLHSVRTEASPKSKKPASKGRGKLHSVKTKSGSKGKGAKKRTRIEYDGSETESDVYQSARSVESAESGDEDDLIPASVLGYMPHGEIMGNGKFAHGLPQTFKSWLDFDACLQEFQDQTYQIFKKRTSSSVVQFNKSSKSYQLPKSFGKYAQTWICTHGMKTQVKKKKKTKKQNKNKNKKRADSARGASSEENSDSSKDKEKSTDEDEGSDGKKVKTRRRQRRFVRFLGCKATINATVGPDFKDAQDPTDFSIRWTASGGHNHRVAADVYRFYPENRLRKSPDVLEDVRRALSMGATAQGILHTYRREQGTPIVIRDVHNLIGLVKQMRVKGTTVEERLSESLQQFASSVNWSSVYVDPDTKLAQSVTFQSARMRRLFDAFPEVVMVDCTHSTNRNKFVLFSFVVHDIFGKGQYVNHSLMHRESIDNMTDAAVAFKKRNRKWDDIRVFMVDKDFKERSVIRTHFPQARILLCHYHTIKYLAKKIKELVRGTKTEKDDLTHVCRALVYAKSRTVYNAIKLLLAKKLGAFVSDEDGDEGSDSSEVPDEQDQLDEAGNASAEDSASDEDEEVDVEDDEVVARIQCDAVAQARDDDDVKRGKRHAFFKYFMKNWESCQDEWVHFHRQNIPHLGNDTNNRIEAKWGQMKRVVFAKMDLEEPIRTIQAMQEASEDEYLLELKQPGTRVVVDEDRELVGLLHHVSRYAYELVKPEYILIKEKVATYAVDERGDSAILRRRIEADDGDAGEHTVDRVNFKCSCFFAQVRLLPCRHVIFYRVYKNFESVIPLQHINLRWSMFHPVNDISVGDPAAPPLSGRFSVKDATRTTAKSMTRGDRFCKAMSVLKPIAAALAGQPPATYEKMLSFFSALEPMVGRGEVPVLAEKAWDIEYAPGHGPDDEVKSQASDDVKSEEGDRADTNFVLPSNASKYNNARKDLRASDAKERLKAVLKEADIFMMKTGRKRPRP